MPDYYIGLMSGTSMDGIDAALVRFGEASIEELTTHEQAYPDSLKRRLRAAIQQPGLRQVDDVADLHREIGICFRNAANDLLARAGIDAGDVAAIGSHGQTVRHEPNAADPFSLQIGDADVIADGTGITTVADFRSADIAAGGQGAPLAPAFHDWLLREANELRVVVNIGGIANVTILPAGSEATIGFDTGPGNTLLDAWCRMHQGRSFDEGGAWSARGDVDEALLRRLLVDPYFSAPPPKSTGFEYFNLDWLEANGVGSMEPVDVQATLAVLTARTIGDAIRDAASDRCDVFICGGGAHNNQLMRLLSDELPHCRVQSTAAAGLDPDWVEAVAFAWLAKRRLENETGSLASVTGASRDSILGVIHTP
ncbi:MAG: anhydro-N-acetylmuramic acid kinase [Woeseiaceae bacterium]|nr:anhydro-N-acetylmuramic acid kinase [Woeseiaceae bacterium]